MKSEKKIKISAYVSPETYKAMRTGRAISNNGLHSPQGYFYPDQPDFELDDNKQEEIVQFLLEHILAPVLVTFIVDALEIGTVKLKQWIQENAAPKSKWKIKDLITKSRPIIAGIKDGLAGKELKIDSVIKENDKIALNEQNNSIYPNFDLKVSEDLQSIIEIMRRSVAALVICIKLLTNMVVDYDEKTPEQKMLIRKEYESLISAEVMNQISLLLEEKNRTLLDSASLEMLSAFRDGNLVINGNLIPISRYLDSDNT